MKERPILFSGPMVRAILDGRKTQTRRVVTPQPAWEIRAPSVRLDDDGATWRLWCADRACATPFWRCPYGAPGDQLWVKETWAVDPCHDDLAPRDLPYSIQEDLRLNPEIAEIRYLADSAARLGKTRPSIFMPRWASRITLEIVSVRVERVQDISEEDAKAEGAEKTRWGDNDWVPVFNTPRGQYIPKLEAESHLAGFFGIWETINAKRGYGWDANPWVWVIEFKRIKP